MQLTNLDQIYQQLQVLYQHKQTTQKFYFKSLKLGGSGKIKLFGFTDASYITKGDSKGQLGNVFFLNYNSGAILSLSKKDTTISHSSTEVELKALDLAIRNIIYIRSMLEDMNNKQLEAATIYIDNNSAIELSKTLKSTNRIKHINM